MSDTEPPNDKPKVTVASGASKSSPGPEGKGTFRGRRGTVKDIVHKYARANQGTSATEKAKHTLQTEIVALAKQEGELLDRLDANTPAQSRSPQLGKTAVALDQTSKKLDTKLKLLRSLSDGASTLPIGSDNDAWRDRELIPELSRNVALCVTDALVARPRARRETSNSSAHNEAPRGQPPIDGAPTNILSPTPVEHHDVLVIAPRGVHADDEFYRFPVIKKNAPEKAVRAVTNGAGSTAADADVDEEKVGQYRDRPELFDAFDYGQRRALSVARPQDWGPASVRATQRGPAFSTLPLKPEPEPASGGTSESSICYLIDTQNLNFRNAWTAEEWNDNPGGVDLPSAQSATKNRVEALLAGPQGKVFRLLLTHIADWKPGTKARVVATNEAGDVQRELGSIESVNLGRHMEVWHQLRGGTAMGRVYFDDSGGPRVIPLVNITTLTLD